MLEIQNVVVVVSAPRVSHFRLGFWLVQRGVLRRLSTTLSRRPNTIAAEVGSQTSCCCRVRPGVSCLQCSWSSGLMVLLPGSPSLVRSPLALSMCAQRAPTRTSASAPLRDPIFVRLFFFQFVLCIPSHAASRGQLCGNFLWLFLGLFVRVTCFARDLCKSN